MPASPSTSEASRERTSPLPLLLALCTPAAAQAAQLEFEADTQRVFSIQPRPYRLGHEFQLGIGVLPLDAFYVGAVATGSYTYHLSDFWAWEIVSGSYSLNFGTGLEDRAVEALPGGADARRRRAHQRRRDDEPGDEAALRQARDLQLERHLLARPSWCSASGRCGWECKAGAATARPLVDVGLGLRFWTGPALSFRFDVRDYLIFNEAVPDNALLLMLSVAFNYYYRRRETRVTP